MAQRIPEQIKQEILDRVDLVGLIAESVPLKKAGNRFVGLCPFHKDKDPSFSVSPDKGFFYCFGCGEHGDAISFLMKSQGMTYVEALENLAKRTGIRIPEEMPEKEKIRAGQYHLLEAAAKFFEDSLHTPAGEKARAILKDRGLDKATQEEFRIGFVPPGWQNVVQFLKKKGVPDGEILQTGLAITGKDGSLYDRFRNRIIFPIQSVSGKVIAFGGRKIDPEDEPKYLNSPETDLFKKAYTLYALNHGKKQIQDTGRVSIVEGYMDAIALHQNGIKNTVATLGTALSVHHFSLVRRYAKEIYLIFDGDPAGIRAAMRGVEVLLPEGGLPLIVQIPGGEDPDTFIRKKGKEAFERVVSDAKDPIQFRMDCLFEGKTSIEREDRVRMLQEIAPVIASSTNPVRRSDWASLVAHRLGIRQEDVFEEINKVHGKSASLISLEEKVSEVDPCAKAKEGLIALLLSGKDVSTFLGEIGDYRTDKGLHDEILSVLLEMLNAGERISVGPLSARFSPEAMRLLTRIEAGEIVPTDHERAAKDYIHTLRQAHIERTDSEMDNDSIDSTDPLVSLREFQRLHEERVSLGMREGFRR